MEGRAAHPDDPLAGRATPSGTPPLAAALGGPLGIAESALPPTVFVAASSAFGQETERAALVAVAVAAVFALVRIVRRQTPVYAVGGVIGVAFAAWIVARTGKAENFFLPGLLGNLAYATACVISIAVRRPLVGYAAQSLGAHGPGWREDPRLLRTCARATWIWAELFLVRLAVQLPLYLAGALVALGTARVAMGVPLFALGIWITWLLLRRERATRPIAAPAA